MAVTGNGQEKERYRTGRKKAMESFSRYYSLAFEMAIAVVVPILIGRWLDGKTGKDPWFTLGGMVLGGAAAFRSVHRTVTEVSRNEKKDGESSE
jgi:F0F1-type ATP synthase assembly protein I